MTTLKATDECDLDCINYHTHTNFSSWCTPCITKYREQKVDTQTVFASRFIGPQFSDWIEHVLCLFWIGYVFHGEYQIQSSLQRIQGYSHPSWDRDIDLVLLELSARGIIKPKRYFPSHSKQGFRCFTGGTVESSWPTLDNARDWEYEVLQGDP